MVPCYLRGRALDCVLAMAQSFLAQVGQLVGRDRSVLRTSLPPSFLVRPLPAALLLTPSRLSSCRSADCLPFTLGALAFSFRSPTSCNVHELRRLRVCCRPLFPFDLDPLVLGSSCVYPRYGLQLYRVPRNVSVVSNYNLLGHSALHSLRHMLCAPMLAGITSRC